MTTPEIIERMARAIEELADELEAELRNRIQPDLHPHSAKRFKRDMVTVNDARAILKAAMEEKQ